MVSFIIVAKDKKKREIYEKEHAAKHAINAFDITIIEKDETKAQSIGIEIVKQIHKKAFLKPIKSAYKLIIIEDAHLLTPEAQNALLKILEEPPANTHIILGTESVDALLSTIISRCQIITLEEDQKEMSEKTIEDLDNFIRLLPELSLEGRLKQAELLAKDKEKAIEWLANIILVLREELITNYSSGERSALTSLGQNSSRPALQAGRQARTIKSFQSLHTLLKTTNVNPRFAIEHTLLSL